MEGQFTYEDFDLLIEPGPPGSYRARVLRSPAGESAPVQFTLPFSSMELENLVLKIGRGRRRARGPGRPESAPLKEFGGRLYSAVFQDELRDALQRSLSLTRAQGVGLRLRLRLADTPELAELPWEFLYDPRHNRFLAQSRRTPLVRYLDLPDPPHPLNVDGPLRLLVMISSLSDQAELDAEQEWSLLTGALAQQQAEGRVIIERLAANMSTLRRRLRQEEFHVFHFIGHGRYRPDWGCGVLVMEDRTGRSHEVTGEELGGLLNEYDETRLAVLNACEGARADASDPFAGVAQSLIQQGLPAVVAMQFEITDDAAIIFAREFYGAIADGYQLEAAMAEARGAIRDEGNLTEWGTPVLYSRAPDGRLFDLTRGALAQAERRGLEQADSVTRQEEVGAFEPGERLKKQGDAEAARAAFQEAVDSSQPDAAAAVPPSTEPRRPLPSVERALRGPGSHSDTSWRRQVKVVAGGQGPGQRDRETVDRDRARLPLAGPGRIAMLGCTRGAGQSVTALMTGRILAAVREVPVAVLDLNPGNTSLAAGIAPATSVTALLAGQEQGGQADSGSGARLDVIGDLTGAGGGHALEEDGYRRLIQILAARYPLTIIDPAPSGLTRILSLADQLVLVVPASPDAATSLDNTQQWLNAHGNEELVARAVVVVNGVSRRTMEDVLRAESVARGNCRAIVRVPWDDLLHQWPDTSAALQPQTRLAYTALAGVLVAGLAADQRTAVPGRSPGEHSD